MEKQLGPRALRNRYFRDALEALTGERPPGNFQWRKSSQTTEQQDWCSLNAKPHWACGYSVMESAERYVSEAEDNGNIVGRREYLSYFPTRWEK